MGSICPCMKPTDSSSEAPRPFLNNQTSEEEEESNEQGEYDSLNTSGKDAKAIPIRNENDRISYSKKISVNDFTLVKVLFHMLSLT